MPIFPDYFFKKEWKKHSARVIEHQNDNPGHRVINWECNSCDFIEVVGWTEADYEKFAEAEYSFHEKSDKIEEEIYDIFYR